MGSCEHCGRPSGSIKCWEILVKLIDRHSAEITLKDEEPYFLGYKAV
jgi:hypothetical protein